MLCQAPKVKTLIGCFGDRCDEPATEVDWLGRHVCAACAQWSRDQRSNPNTLGAVLSKALQDEKKPYAAPAVRDAVCFVCGSAENIRHFATTVDGEALRMAPFLCGLHGDRYLLSIGIVLATLRNPTVDELAQPCDTCGKPRGEHTRSPACDGFTPSWKL
jgi:hypothetical protein